MSFGYVFRVREEGGKERKGTTFFFALATLKQPFGTVYNKVGWTTQPCSPSSILVVYI